MKCSKMIKKVKLNKKHELMKFVDAQSAHCAECPQFGDSWLILNDSLTGVIHYPVNTADVSQSHLVNELCGTMPPIIILQTKLNLRG